MSSNNNLKAAIAASLKEAAEAANLNAKERQNLQKAINATKMNAHRALQEEKEWLKAFAAANRPRSRSNSVVSVKLVNVPGDGDCFYASVIAAIKDQRIPVEECFGFELTIQNLRNYISDNIEETAKGIYETYHSLNNSNTKKSIIEGLASWHKQIIRTANTPAKFVKDIKAGVRKMNNWAAQMEVEVMKEVLFMCNVILDIKYNDTKYTSTGLGINSKMGNRKFIKQYSGNSIPTLSKMRNGMHVITLFNEGESHYQYYAFNRHTGGRRLTRRSTRKPLA